MVHPLYGLKPSYYGIFEDNDPGTPADGQSDSSSLPLGRSADWSFANARGPQPTCACFSGDRQTGSQGVRVPGNAIVLIGPAEIHGAGDPNA